MDNVFEAMLMLFFDQHSTQREATHSQELSVWEQVDTTERRTRPSCRETSPAYLQVDKRLQFRSAASRGAHHGDKLPARHRKTDAFENVHRARAVTD